MLRAVLHLRAADRPHPLGQRLGKRDQRPALEARPARHLLDLAYRRHRIGEAGLAVGRNGVGAGIFEVRQQGIVVEQDPLKVACAARSS